MANQKERQMNRQDSARMEEIKAKAFETRRAYARAFSSEDGQKVLADLKVHFGQPTIGSDAHIMVVQGSMRAVIDHIVAAIELGDENDG